MHAAGERAVGLDGGVAVLTAAGRAVTTDTVVRAAGIAAIAITTAAEVLAASLEDLGLASVAFGHRGLQVLLQFAATTALQLVLHNDGQSLHNGFVLGCPWEDMNSIAKTATATVALRPATLETIVVDGCCKLCYRARLQRKRVTQNVRCEKLAAYMMMCG